MNLVVVVIVVPIDLMCLSAYSRFFSRSDFHPAIIAAPGHCVIMTCGCVFLEGCVGTKATWLWCHRKKKNNTVMLSYFNCLVFSLYTFLHLKWQ